MSKLAAIEEDSTWSACLSMDEFVHTVLRSTLLRVGFVFACRMSRPLDGATAA
jgi:hypothetical protein